MNNIINGGLEVFLIVGLFGIALGLFGLICEFIILIYKGGNYKTIIEKIIINTWRK
tara:strand:- start:734 stop:901 length:168 start_codon:yes stop_codon:yes gene_type:complete